MKELLKDKPKKFRGGGDNSSGLQLRAIRISPEMAKLLGVEGQTKVYLRALSKRHRSKKEPRKRPAVKAVSGASPAVFSLTTDVVTGSRTEGRADRDGLPAPAASGWTDVKNIRRCELIDKDIDSFLTVEERAELESLEMELRRHVNAVAPRPLEALLEEVRALVTRFGGAPA